MDTRLFFVAYFAPNQHYFTHKVLSGRSINDAYALQRSAPLYIRTHWEVPI